jgi:thiol-disulfide isomerase/thioredoxin
MRYVRTIIGITLLLGGTGWAQNDAKSLLTAGDQLRREGKPQEAYKNFEKANKSLEEKCETCMARMAMMKLSLGDPGGSLKLADRALSVAANSSERADAYAVKGEILLMVAEDNAKKLASAEEAWQSAVKEDPDASIFHMKLGQTLLREGKVESGTKELQGYLDTPNCPNAELVSKWIAHPAKARYLLTPEFVVDTSKGERIESKNLQGKVVLIDFWATWCPPCRASVPELKELTKKYPAERLEVISVSSDSKPEAWKDFIAAKQMDWPQYLDSDEHMTKLFVVHSFPTYIIIDGDGFVRERITSYDPQQSLASRLKEPLKKMLE